MNKLYHFFIYRFDPTSDYHCGDNWTNSRSVPFWQWFIGIIGGIAGIFGTILCMTPIILHYNWIIFIGYWSIALIWFLLTGRYIKEPDESKSRKIAYSCFYWLPVVSFMVAWCLATIPIRMLNNIFHGSIHHWFLRTHKSLAPKDIKELPCVEPPPLQEHHTTDITASKVYRTAPESCNECGKLK